MSVATTQNSGIPKKVTRQLTLQACRVSTALLACLICRHLGAGNKSPALGSSGAA